MTHDPFAYPLLDALRHRRSRRFGAGMSIPSGPLRYTSAHAPVALSEAEEAALVFAACGLTGYALADLSYGEGQGGNMMASFMGRTISSPDAIHAVSLSVTNDAGTYFIKRPQNHLFSDLANLVKLGESGNLLELYRRSRVQLREGRVAPPVQPGYNFDINKWSLYAPGSTYFVPINEMGASMINALLAAFEPSMGLFVIDERRFFQPAGIGRFAKRKGGALHDDPADGRVVTVQGFEMSMAEAIAIEQGMMLQNLGLMTQALGLGGFANYARHEYSWFEVLGFRMADMPASRYGGAPKGLSRILGALGKDVAYQFPLGLEHDGEVLLKPYCPPYYASMKEAVHAFVDWKYGSEGMLRQSSRPTYWREPAHAMAHIHPPSDAAIEATVAYCEYIYGRYGRFPAYAAPFRTVIGYQASVLDTDFYEQFYQPEALSETQHQRHK